MFKSPEQTPLVSTKSIIVALALAIIGIVLIVLGNAIDLKYWKIDFGSNIAGVGALFLVIGILQWFFDRYVRSAFFAEVREEILGSTQAAQSGICGFYEDSKSVNFTEYFISSTDLTIGVNYSGKLIDNCIKLLAERTRKGNKTTIITIKTGGYAQKFIEADYSHANVEDGLRKIDDIVNSLDSERKLIQIKRVSTVLRYSFVHFDSRIWIVFGTNGPGRRAVPGFYVSKRTPWHSHFEEDIRLLLERVE
ncbi:hypothetical protein BOMU111920_07870 [Bordetella muralis]